MTDTHPRPMPSFHVRDGGILRECAPDCAFHGSADEARAYLAALPAPAGPTSPSARISAHRA